MCRREYQFEKRGEKLNGAEKEKRNKLQMTLSKPSRTLIVEEIKCLKLTS